MKALHTLGILSTSFEECFSNGLEGALKGVFWVIVPLRAKQMGWHIAAECSGSHAG
jgi:hypothetical protein